MGTVCLLGTKSHPSWHVPAYASTQSRTLTPKSPGRSCHVSLPKGRDSGPGAKLD